MLRPFLGALCAFLVSLILVSPASAVPDGPLDVYLEHLEPLDARVAGRRDGHRRLRHALGPDALGIDIGILSRSTCARPRAAR